MVVAVAALRWPVSLVVVVVVVVVVVAAWWSVVVVVVVARRSVALVVIAVAGRSVALVVVVSWLLVSLVLAWRALLLPIKKARQKPVTNFCQEEKVSFCTWWKERRVLPDIVFRPLPPTVCPQGGTFQ